MNLDSNIDGTADLTVASSGDGRVSGNDRRRVDLRRVLTGLRHLHGSSEPARVFTKLAAVCVPALCDQMVIDIDENRADEKGIDQAGVHRYRIRQPGGLPRPETEDPSPRLSPGQVVATGQQVTAVVGSLPGGGPRYTARLLCVWNPGYMPTDTDAALIGVLADHAVALVHRERSTGHLTDPATAGQVGAALGRTQRVAAATGILMALHHLTAAQARQLLVRAGDRTHQSLVQVADTVLHTGGLPDQRTTRPPETPAPVAPDPDPDAT
jgi:hypothetical protein